MTEAYEEQADPLDGICALNRELFWPVLQYASARGVEPETLIMCLLDLACEVTRRTYPYAPHGLRSAALSQKLDYLSAAMDERTPSPVAYWDMTNVEPHPLWSGLFSSGHS